MLVRVSSGRVATNRLTEDSRVHTLAAPTMARKKYSFYIEETQSDALKSIKARDGVLESEQVRRALDDWIAKKAVREGLSRRTPARRKVS